MADAFVCPPDQSELRARTLTAAARLNHDMTAAEREALADELAAIAMELRANEKRRAS